MSTVDFARNPCKSYAWKCTHNKVWSPKNNISAYTSLEDTAKTRVAWAESSKPRQQRLWGSAPMIFCLAGWVCEAKWDSSPGDGDQQTGKEGKYHRLSDKGNFVSALNHMVNNEPWSGLPHNAIDPLSELRSSYYNYQVGPCTRFWGIQWLDDSCIHDTAIFEKNDDSRRRLDTEAYTDM